MVIQVPGLAALPVKIEIGTPGLLRQREAALVLLSMTRSHTHRPVAFGESPEMLALALTRARHRLVIFGDAGTLARRGQWEGPLEHLDGTAAGRERHLIAHLVTLLDGQERSKPRQGNGA